MANKKLNGEFKAAQFAKDILAKREKENITYAVAEKQTNVYKSIIHRAESGLPISLENLPKLCNWLGKQVQHYFIFMLLFSLPFISFSQSKAVDKIPVNLSAGTNVTVSFIDMNTGKVYVANNAFQVVSLPKKGVFEVRLQASNFDEPNEINYQLQFDGNYIGISLQPGQSFWVSTNQIEFNKNSEINLIRL